MSIDETPIYFTAEQKTNNAIIVFFPYFVYNHKEKTKKTEHKQDYMVIFIMLFVIHLFHLEERLRSRHASDVTIDREGRSCSLQHLLGSVSDSTGSDTAHVT